MSLVQKKSYYLGILGSFQRWGPNPYHYYFYILIARTLTLFKKCMPSTIIETICI